MIHVEVVKGQALIETESVAESYFIQTQYSPCSDKR